MTRRTAFRCDAGPAVGIGHVMRSLALAEELAARGGEPVFFCDSASVPWAHGQLLARGFTVRLPPVSPLGHVRAFTDGGFDAVVFDSYRLRPEVYRAVRATLPTLAIVDGPLRGALADLYLDQNVGAEDDRVEVPAGARRLAGVGYALVRDDVLGVRPLAPPTARHVDHPSVFVVFGGTDASGSGPAALSALVATGRAFQATLVAPREELRSAAEAVERSPGQRLRVIGPTDQLARLVREADLVVSAAGSSCWELMTLGACAALVRVADNQELGYQRLVETGAALGLGGPADLASDGASSRLTGLLDDPDRRTGIARRAWRLVDGSGRGRVADALEAVAAQRR